MDTWAASSLGPFKKDAINTCVHVSYSIPGITWRVPIRVSTDKWNCRVQINTLNFIGVTVSKSSCTSKLNK